MKKRRVQRGFTLVELAVSLTIIGLLIGGILQGRQMMENARIASAVAQVGAIKAATTTFIGTYNGLPGDIKNAHIRIPKCPNCELDSTSSWAGNGMVGLPNWDLFTAQGNSSVGTRPLRREENETLLFWAELAQSGLFSGVSYNGDTLTAGTAQFGVHAPAARTGGGWVVGQANGTTTQRIGPVTPSLSVTRPLGLFLVLAPSPVQSLTTTRGAQVLEPLSASGIDEKIDDGKTLTGSVVAYGFTSLTNATGCYNGGTRPEPPLPYNEAVDSKDCGLLVQIND